VKPNHFSQALEMDVSGCFGKGNNFRCLTACQLAGKASLLPVGLSDNKRVGLSDQGCDGRHYFSRRGCHHDHALRLPVGLSDLGCDERHFSKDASVIMTIR